MRAAAFLLLLAACDDSPSAIQPLPAVTTEAGVPTPAAARRTVGHRNPFGDALQSDNLMADGDFELTGRSGQAPWTVYNNQNQGTLNYDTGGHCRSGIRCGVIGVGDQLVGVIASPPNMDFIVRLYVLPDSGRCSDVDVLLVDLNSGSEAGSVPPPSAPGPDGWCLFEGSIGNMAYESPRVFVSLSMTAKSKTARIDDATALPSIEVPIHGIQALRPVDDAAKRAQVEQVAAWIRAHVKYGRRAERYVP